MHQQVIDVIRQDPADRCRHKIQMFIPWLKSKSHLLNELDADVLKNLVCNCYYKRSAADEVLIRQGEVGDCLYIILEGSVRVFIDENAPIEDKSARSPRNPTPQPSYDRLVVRHPSANRQLSQRNEQPDSVFSNQLEVPDSDITGATPRPCSRQGGSTSRQGSRGGGSTSRQGKPGSRGCGSTSRQGKPASRGGGSTSRQGRPGSRRASQASGRGRPCSKKGGSASRQRRPSSKRGGSASHPFRQGSAKQKEDSDENKGQLKGQLKKKVTQIVREKKDLDKLSKESKSIVTLGVGQCFGEIALISTDNRRNATVVAAEETHLLVINKTLYNHTLKEFHQRDYAERLHFINRHQLFHNWKLQSKSMLMMSLEKKTLPFESTIVSQGDPVDGLLFLIRGSASVSVESSKHDQQYPNMYPFMSQSDVYSDTYLKHQRDQYVNESKRQRMVDHRTNLRDRRRDYAAIERRAHNRRLTLCSVQYPELIGDVEYVCNLRTHAHTVTCTTVTDVFHLNGKNTERLIMRKNPGTFKRLKTMVEAKLRYRVDALQTVAVPLLNYLLVQSTKKPKAPERCLAQLRPSKTVPDEEYLFLHMLDTYLQDKGQLSRSHVPGAVYYRQMMREKAKRREDARQRAGIGMDAKKGLPRKTRHTIVNARSTSVLRAALKRDEEESVRRRADARLREEHEREESLLKEMLVENRQFIEDYLEKCEMAGEKKQPVVNDKARVPAATADATAAGGGVTTGVVNANYSNNGAEAGVQTVEAQVVPEQNETVITTVMTTAEDGQITQKVVVAEPVANEQDTGMFPPLSHEASHDKPVYTDWETSDKSLNYLERRLQLFNPTYGKRKAPVRLPKLKRFEAKTDLIPGGKVIIKQKQCSFAKIPYRLLDHSHEHHHMIAAIPEYDRLRRANVLKHYMADRLREKWIAAHNTV